MVRIRLEEGKKKSSGKKDACYHKVKSRYKAFPSAYASGALVKCRKVGAKNWGNSKKNESIEEALDPQEEKELKTIKMQLNKSAAKHARQAKQATDIAQASEKSSKLHAKQVKTIDKMLGEELIPGGLGSELTGDMEHQHKEIADMHNISVEEVEKQIQKGIKVEMEHTSDPEYAHEIAMDHVIEDPNYYDKLVKLKLEAKRKLTSKPSSETNLRDWFKRKGSPGKTGGWVDCNTCRNGKCKPCGRQEGESRSKYPACRPTPAACKKKSKTWGKKSKKGMKESIMESRDIKFANHTRIVNLMQEMFGNKIIVETQKVETKRGTTLKLPRFQINEKDWGQRVDTKDRSTIELIGSQLKGDTPLTRVAFAQEFINSAETVKERITVSEVMANLMFLDLFSSVVNNFNEAVAGFLFESLFAGIFQGKQIPAKEADTTTDAILKVKYRGGPEDVPYSFKLLTKGATQIGGSLFDLFNGICKEGKEIYLVGLKTGESPKIGIELYEFPVDRENWFEITAKPKITTEQSFDYAPLDVQNIVQSGQIPDMDVIRNNQKVKLASALGLTKGKTLSTGNKTNVIFIKNGEQFQTVKGQLPVDREYFVKQPTGEKKVAMPTGIGLNTYAPFVEEGSVREGFKEAVGKYFEEFIVDPAAMKEKENLIFDRENSPLNLAPAFQKQFASFAVTQNQLLAKEPALKAEGPATLVLDKEKFTEAANAYTDKVGQEIYDLFTNLANLVDDVSGYFLTANQGERNQFAKDSKESSKKLAQSAEENLVEVESDVMRGIVLDPAPASKTPSKQDVAGPGMKGLESGVKTSKKESKDPTLKENKSIKLKMNRPTTLRENLQFHLENNITMDKSVLRFGSDSHIRLIKETKRLWEQGRYFATPDEEELFQTDIGEYALFEGKMVPLDVPMLNEEIIEEKKTKKDPPLNKPTTNPGGGKKWKVYVRSKSGGIKKVTFGDQKGGLKGNWNDPKARASFAKRHKCAEKKDKTQAGYWACRAHKYFGKNVPGRFW